MTGTTTTGCDDAAGDDAAGVNDAGDERAQRAAEHFQRASLELIEAARAVLDIAEEAVREPGELMTVLTDTFAGLAEAIGGLAPGWMERARRAAPGSDRGDAADPAAPAGSSAPAAPATSDSRPATRRPKVQHIQIS
jgi:hypothetical protein